MKIPTLTICTLVLALCLVTSFALAQDARGHLVIIGGGGRTTEMMKRFVALAGGGEKANIAIIPLASGDPREAYEEAAVEFKNLGARQVSCLLFSKAEAAADSTCEKFNGVTGVFFTGGDQVRVTRVIVGTPVHRRLLQLYRDGAVMGGTSAGAAIMSKVMITGDELINKDSTNMFKSIQKGNVETVEGLGFLDQVVVDQHFVKRKRLNRLISVILEHPTLPGIGIDESTAVVVSPGGGVEVMGEGAVVVLDARHAGAIHTDTRGNLVGQNIVMHIYSAGDKFDLKTVQP
jgi:cyanophycinase